MRVPKPHPGVALHRTEKPIKLLKWLISTYSSKDARILDNCMGAGGCGVACAETDRFFIGIEKDPDCFHTAESRITGAYKKAL